MDLAPERFVDKLYDIVPGASTRLKLVSFIPKLIILTNTVLNTILLSIIVQLL